MKDFEERSKETGKLLKYELEKEFEKYKLYRVYEVIKQGEEVTYRYLYKTTKKV